MASSAPAFIDANVALYASGLPSPYREPCAQIIRALGEGRLGAVTDVEVLQEIVHFCHRRGQLARGLEVARSLAGIVQTVYPFGLEDTLTMMDLLERAPALDTWDAIHAAVMLRHGLTHIVTADRDFAGVPGLTALDPLALALDLIGPEGSA